MITVTERATTRLQEVLSARRAPAGHGLKLVLRWPDSVGLTIATPSAGDAVIRHGDVPLLIVDRRLTGLLDGAALDYRPPPAAGRVGEGGQGHGQFTIRRSAEEDEQG